MKKLWEMALSTLFLSIIAGFGLASGAAACLGWLKFISKAWG